MQIAQPSKPSAPGPSEPAPKKAAAAASSSTDEAPAARALGLFGVLNRDPILWGIQNQGFLKQVPTVSLSFSLSLSLHAYIHTFIFMYKETVYIHVVWTQQIRRCGCSALATQLGILLSQTSQFNPQGLKSDLGYYHSASHACQCGHVGPSEEL